MRGLRETYVPDERISGLRSALLDDRELVLGAAHGSFPALALAAALGPDRGRPRGAGLVVCPDPDDLADDLEALGLRARVLPEIDEFERASDDDRSALSRRTAVLERVLAGDLLLATPRAAEQPVPRLDDLSRHALHLRPGERLDLHELAELLVEEGYQVAPVVEGPGQLAQRGGVVDVFPWAAELPVRLEFFDDQLETIRRFDPSSQESIARLEAVTLAPGGRGSLATEPLVAQLPPGPVLVLGDVAWRDRTKRDHGRREVRLARHLENGADDAETSSAARLMGDQHRDFADLAALAADNAITVLARNQEVRTALTEDLADRGLEAEILVGRLSAGWRDLARARVVVHDFELSHRRPTRRRTANRVSAGAPLSSLADLKPGDHVVHLNHGIARFRGMATLEKRGWLEDFLLLEFAEETRLYVPVSAIDLVQKYIGGAGRHPQPDKLGGAAWKRRRARAEKAVEDLAAELLTNAAARLAAGGIAHPGDDREQRRFEAAFPFEETEDQLAAMREIKADLVRPVAMDRLLCGDVGFGKTELAMRAAWVCVRGGRQVALLCPTTILAEQHLASFSERFAATGTRLAGVNRFRTAKEKREIFSAAAAGDLDILIGTHAILNQGLEFADLGLLIVDEEQRFGVKHKEHLKALRSGVDVLTLSATPIPRTLHFGMSGLRDISVLAEAPAERLAVETRVAPWDKALIRQALSREIERGGQVFFVHNRVEDIEALAFRLARIVPDLRYEIVHGQMPERRIAETMARFKRSDTQCLIATSIVESGLDIPNANTLIVNNAHCFGLAELHQLRGRVGRFTRQAYAYFLVPEFQSLGQEATERLDAIQEYAELGAGFKLAMRDLEIRGAGNLLGSEQSGHIAAIGYELYLKLLYEAVSRSGGAVPDLGRKGGAGAALAFPLDAYVPDDFCEAPALKFELHKALDDAPDERALAAVAASARDRFGPLPAPVERLVLAKAVRMALAGHGVTRAAVNGRELRLEVDGSLPQALGRSDLPGLAIVRPVAGGLALAFRVDLDQDRVLAILATLAGVEPAALLP